jgi:hypothetical protein
VRRPSSQRLSRDSGSSTGSGGRNSGDMSHPALSPSSFQRRSSGAAPVPSYSRGGK